MMLKPKEGIDTPRSAQWLQFLWRSGLVLGMLLCASAVIIFIAANWSHIAKVWRIAGVQALLAVLVGLSLYLGRCNALAWKRVYSPATLLLTVASVVVGGLFALLGQTYQTGADPWQLFALWALILLPWLWASRSVVMALFWMGLVNLSLVLWLGTNVGPDFLFWIFDRTSSWSLVLLNAAFLLLAEKASSYIADRYRLLQRAALLFLISAMSAEVLAAVSNTEHFLLVFGVATILSGALWYWYLNRARSVDVLMGSLTYALVFVLSIALLGQLELYRIEYLLVVVVLHGVLAFFMIRDLSRRWRRTKQRRSNVKVAPQDESANESDVAVEAKQPWFLRVFRSIIALFLGAMLSVFVGSSFWSDAPYVSELIMVLGFVTAIVLSRSANSLWRQDMAAVVLVLGMVFGVFSHFMSSGGPHHGVLLLYMALGIGLYYYCRAWPMRFLSSIWVIGHFFTWVIYLNPYHFWLAIEQDRTALVVEFYAMLFVLIALFMAAMAHRNERHYGYLSPAMWASVLASFVAVFPLQSLWALDAEIGWVWHWQFSSFVVMMLPTLSLYVALRRSNALNRNSVLTLIMMGGATLAWTGFPTLSLAITWGVLAYFWRNTTLQVIAGLAVLVALNQFYYSLALSLNVKALMLIVTGLWLVGVSALLPRAAKSRSSLTQRSSSGEKGLPYRPTFVLLGLFMCLGVANYDVWSKERLLRTGQAVVLELAPVDPRSLMQGDYMTLRFSVGNELAQQLYGDEAEALRQHSRLWLWLAPDQYGVAWRLRGIQTPDASEPVFWIQEGDTLTERQASALTLQKPDDVALSSLIKLRVRRDQLGWTPGTNAWFFAEGQAERFEAARYGEFVVADDGKALLRALMNSEGHVID